MVRQARSEATRRKIIDSAVDLINEIGYPPAAGLGDIIERAELTKGALYYHFDSKEALATAIIEEGSETVLGAFRGGGPVGVPPGHGEHHPWLVRGDRRVEQRQRGQGRGAATPYLRRFQSRRQEHSPVLVDELVEHLVKATTEGDVREGLDPESTSASIVAGMLGAELLSSALTDGADIRTRFARNWELLLPAIVTDASLGYYREFLARQAARQHPTSP